MAFPKPIDGSKLPLDTKGDLIVFGKKNERLPVGTNGQVLTADSAQSLGVKWATPASGGSIPERWYTPKDADEGYDDEFDDGSIDADWNAVDVPSYANTWFEVAGIKGLSLLTAAGKGSYKITGLLRSMGTMTAPCFIETAVKGDSRLFNYPGLGLIFADGVTYDAGTQVIFMGPMPGGYRSLFRYTKYNTRESYADLQSQEAAIRDRLYMRFYWSAANTFSTYISPNGIVWAPMHSAVSLTCSPTYFGLCVSGLDNDTYPIVGDFAYFRARSGAPANG